MNYLTIILFLVYSWALGFTALRWTTKVQDRFGRFLIRVMVGFGVFPLLFSVLNLVQWIFQFTGLIDWKFILVLSLIAPLYDLVAALRKGAKFPQLVIHKFVVTKNGIIKIALIALFCFHLFMFLSGSFAYSWLEDSDPWKHAAGSYYIAQEKTLFHNPNAKFSSYFDPYPASFNTLLAILYQTSDSMNWTLKFFNALFWSMCVLFVFYLAEALLHDRRKALFAAFAYTMIPATGSHFIWSHTLAPSILIIGLFCYQKFFQDKTWMVPATITLSAFLLTTPTAGVKLVTAGFLLYIGWVAMTRKAQWVALGILAASIVLSMTWWGVEFYRYGGVAEAYLSQPGLTTTPGGNFAGGAQGEGSFLASAYQNIRGFLNPRSGSESRAYTFGDFFIATGNNNINGPKGIGVVICLLAIAGILVYLFQFKSLISTQHGSRIPVLLLFIFTFLGVNSVTFNLPIGLFAFRFWMLLAIPISLLAAEGYMLIHETLKKAKVNVLIPIAIVVALVFFTSGYQSWQINTGVWAPSSGFEYSPNIMEDLQGYDWLFTLPPETKVIGSKFAVIRVFGYDKMFCLWCADDVAFRESLFNRTPQEIHSWMKENQYGYLIIDPSVLKPIGPLTPEETNAFISNIAQSNLFNGAYQTQTTLIIQPV